MNSSGRLVAKARTVAPITKLGKPSFCAQIIPERPTQSEPLIVIASEIKKTIISGISFNYTFKENYFQAINLKFWLICGKIVGFKGRRMNTPIKSERKVQTPKSKVSRVSG